MSASRRPVASRPKSNARKVSSERSWSRKIAIAELTIGAADLEQAFLRIMQESAEEAGDRADRASAPEAA